MSARAQLAAELLRCHRQAAVDHPLRCHVWLPERHLYAETIHQPAEREREVIGVGAGVELAAGLAVAHDLGDQSALAPIEPDVRVAHGRITARPDPNLHP
jgi:hypothetical protein